MLVMMETILMEMDAIKIVELNLIGLVLEVPQQGLILAHHYHHFISS